MVIKIDLEKAHDKIWDFLRDSLLDIGLSNFFVNLTMECVSSCNMRIIQNGGATSVFATYCGIREGDSISIRLIKLKPQLKGKFGNMSTSIELVHAFHTGIAH